MTECYRFAKKGSCRFGDDCRFEHVAEVQAEKRNGAKKRADARGSERKTTSKNHIAEFFAMYPTYDYDPFRSFMQQFYVMCDFFEWEKTDKDRISARKRLQDAMVLQFNATYGSAANDLQAWQAMCGALEIDPVPDKLKECREAVLKVHANICDLVDAPILGKPKIFPTEAALSVYTRKAGKFFPRSNVHAGSLLRFLLRHFLSYSSSGSYLDDI